MLSLTSAVLSSRIQEDITDGKVDATFSPAFRSFDYLRRNTWCKCCHEKVFKKKMRRVWREGGVSMQCMYEKYDVRRASKKISNLCLAHAYIMLARFILCSFFFPPPFYVRWSVLLKASCMHDDRFNIRGNGATIEMVHSFSGYTYARN